MGSTRAALTYYSENYTAQMNMSRIGVTLQENGNDVSNRDYEGNGDWEGTVSGTLLNHLAESKIVPEQKYPEALTVKNSGNIDTFVRVIITKYWENPEGEKDNTLNPALIELDAPLAGWIEDESARTTERSIYYYQTALKAGDEGNISTPLCENIWIDGSIAELVEQVTNEEEGTIQYIYKYNDYTFVLEAEVNAVQTHNAAEAIRSAWGVDATVSADETTITGIQ